MLYTSCTCKFYCVIGLSMRDALRIAKCQLYSGEWVINTSSWCIACIVYYTLTGYAGMSRWKRYKALGVRKRYVVWQWMTDTGSSCIVLKCTSQELNILGERTVHEVMFDKALFRSCLVVFSELLSHATSISCLQLSTCSLCSFSIFFSLAWLTPKYTPSLIHSTMGFRTFISEAKWLFSTKTYDNKDRQKENKL